MPKTEQFSRSTLYESRHPMRRRLRCMISIVRNKFWRWVDAVDRMANEEHCTFHFASSNESSTSSTTLPTSRLLTAAQQLLFASRDVIDEVATVTSTAWASTGGGGGDDYSPSGNSSKLIEDVLYRVVIVTVCVIGLICNIINLLVLSRKSLTATMERLERSAHYGLVGERSTNTRPYWYIMYSFVSQNHGSTVNKMKPN